MMFYAALLSILAQVLVFIEFFMPGGVLAALAALSVLVGTCLVAASDAGWQGALIYLAVNIVFAVFIAFLALKKIRRSAKTDTFYLSKDQSGYASSDYSPTLIGQMGIATSDMKPSGHIEVAGTQYQAVSDRGYITKGQSIEITALRSSYYVVIPHTNP